MSKQDEKKLPNFFEFLSSLNQRITALERIITKDESKPVYQKVRLPTYDLESNAKVMTDAGIVDILNVPVCSVCHRVIKQDEPVFLCHTCGAVLDSSHAIMINNRAHCPQHCRQEHFDLSRKDYKSLICVANGIDDIDEIADLTGILPQDIELSLAKLSMSNLIICKNKLFGLVKEIKTSDEGLLAIAVYRRYFYGCDEDMELFGKTLRKYLSKEEGFDAGV